MKPVGDGVEGFTIRVVEVTVLDLETNTCLTPTVVVAKTVEKRFLDARYVEMARRRIAGPLFTEATP